MEQKHSMEERNSGKEFRFAIMGAGNIAGRFCDAAKLVPGAVVTAVASKSTERAREFAAKNGICHAYGDYEQMLKEEKPDCVYIAVLPSDHFRLCMLCMEHDTPVLCEKAMFTGSGEARRLFAEAGRRGVFAMEALWSFFLPPLGQVKRWMEEGRVGEVTHVDFSIGFLAEKNPANRFFDKELAGGAAYDITVYAYEIVTHLMGQSPSGIQVSARWGETGVDVTDHVVLQYPGCMATLTASIVAPIEDKLIVYGSQGRIVLPAPHYGNEAFLYDRKGELAEHFRDQVTQNGFTYEIQEVMDCVRAGRLQSPTASWEMTTQCAELFDRIEATKGSVS